MTQIDLPGAAAPATAVSLVAARNINKPKPKPSAAAAPEQSISLDQDDPLDDAETKADPLTVAYLVGMGFSKEDAEYATILSDGDQMRAVEICLESASNSIIPVSSPPPRSQFGGHRRGDDEWEELPAHLLQPDQRSSGLPPAFSLDEDALVELPHVATLVSMGFNKSAAEQAVMATGGNLERAIEHMKRSSPAAAPQPPPLPPQRHASSAAAAANDYPAHVATLVSMGFNKSAVEEALKATGGNMERAIEHMQQHPSPPEAPQSPQSLALDVDMPAIAPSPRPASATADPVHVATLVSMGFNKSAVEDALKATGGNMERAIEHMQQHPSPPEAPQSPQSLSLDVDMPAIAPSPRPASAAADPAHVATLVSMGFDKDAAEYALVAAGGNLERAMDLLSSSPVRRGKSPVPSERHMPSEQQAQLRRQIRDKPGLPRRSPSSDSQSSRDCSSAVAAADPAHVATLVSMGFNQDTAECCLKEAEGNLERAMDLLFEMGSTSDRGIDI